MTAYEVVERAPGVVHYVEDRLAYASSGTRILRSVNGGETWEELARLSVPLRARAGANSRMLRRLLRIGVHHLLPCSDDALVVLGFGRVFRVEAETGRVQDVTAIHGGRPLNLERFGTALYYGEYRPNPERSPVSVWRGRDGARTWEAAWTFEGIRHVHGVFADPWSGDIWLTTGDEDAESGLWVTRDDFSTLERVLGGTQQWRVVQIVFTYEHIYFGSDTPRERNHIYRMDRSGENVTPLVEVEGSVFHGIRRGDRLLFSTACEPSRVNTRRVAEVWMSTQEAGWCRIAHFEKDWLPMKLFQYGQVLFPAGTGESGYLWLTPFATRGDQLSLKIRHDDPASASSSEPSMSG